MKRKRYLQVAAFFALAVLLCACGRQDIGEAKAKQIGLDYINQTFGVNETEATVWRNVEECLPDQEGALVTGDPDVATRVVYYIRVARNETQPLYEAYIIGSTGKPFYISQGEINIVLTDAQKEQANELFAQERSWGERHRTAATELKAAGVQWITEHIAPQTPVVLATRAEDGIAADNPVTVTFTDSNYIVLKDGTVYQLRMQWPSMQVLSLFVWNENETGLRQR